MTPTDDFTPEQLKQIYDRLNNPQQPEPAPRHIDTPDELLELLASVSSDPQIEGLSLAQKASTMALLYAAKALQQIADQLGDIYTALEQVGIRIDKGFISACTAINTAKF